jgi:hypothetical protein
MLKVASFALQVATLATAIWLIANHPTPTHALATWTAAAPAVP